MWVICIFIVIFAAAYGFPWFETLFKWCFAVPFLGASLGVIVWSITGLLGLHVCSSRMSWEQIVTCEARSLGIYAVCGIIVAGVLMFKVK